MSKAKILILVIAIALMVSCMPQRSYYTSTASVSTAATITPPRNPKPSETAVLTHTPTITPTPIPTITWTPFPTLPLQEKYAKIQNLLRTNNDCKLPCWWGIVPGKTTWSEAIRFLSPMIFHLTELEGSSDKLVEYKINEALEPEHLWFDVQNNVVVWISTYQPETYYTYQLHQVLGALGVPEQIFISARSTVGKFGAELPPAILVLDYSQIGVWAAFGYLPTRAGDNILICPHDFEKTTSIYELYRTVGGRLELFDPTRENRWGVPMIEVIGAYVDNTWGSEATSKLEDATNMTIESFYQTFVDPTSNACLETPVNLWP